MKETRLFDYFMVYEICGPTTLRCFSLHFFRRSRQSIEEHRLTSACESLKANETPHASGKYSGTYWGGTSLNITACVKRQKSS
jgi:hypothetical protein